MATKNASEVAKRCLCLELLLQRVGLELDDEDHVDKRDAFRKAWVSRLGDLELEDALLADERGYLLRPVDELTQEEVDEIEGRIISALVLLWALGRVPSLPTAAALGDAPALVADHGVLGDGSVSAARETVAKAGLRPVSDLDAALAAAHEARGDVSEAMTPEQMVAGITLHALAWVLDPGLPFAIAGETPAVAPTVARP
jgi:hypothetical protein